MTKEDLKKRFEHACTRTDANGQPVIRLTPDEMFQWIETQFLSRGAPLFSNAFTGMHDKHGKPIHEGDKVKLYYKGEYVICQVIYDIKHAAFFIKWPDGYVNQYFMNGSNYEVVAGDSKQA